ncbi:MAG: hypothetical protein VX130_05025 [Verrucomicrobiota bacterium]|nr:hypothetical protein [Verrucomicrobiota bacterium]
MIKFHLVVVLLGILMLSSCTQIITLPVNFLLNPTSSTIRLETTSTHDLNESAE